MLHIYKSGCTGRGSFLLLWVYNDTRSILPFFGFYTALLLWLSFRWTHWLTHNQKNTTLHAFPKTTITTKLLLVVLVLKGVLDVHDNNLVGTMPKEICDLKLEALVADCYGSKPEVRCDCCTVCCQGLPYFGCVDVKTGKAVDQVY
jgi:hypothetical protein